MRPKASTNKTRFLQAEVARLEELAADRMHFNEQLQYEVSELKKQVQSRAVATQLASRERLAASLATLMEACAHAIQYTVAKESI